MKDLFDEDEHHSAIAKFSLRNPSHPDDDLCYIVPGKPETLAACAFNSSSKTFLVIHGWTVSTATFETRARNYSKVTTLRKF